MTIKGYKITTFYAVYYNGEFSHNVKRERIIDAQSVSQAEGIISLRKAGETIVDDSLIITTSSEGISHASTVCIGRRRYRKQKYYGDLVEGD